MTKILTPDRPKPTGDRPEPEGSGSRTPDWLADLALVVSFLALTFLLGIFPLKDTDFWWHLKAGDLIRQSGQVPTVDTFTYGAEGRPWVDLHWGFQVVVSWGYAHGGVVTLNLAKCVITTLAVFLLIRSRRRDWPVWVMLMAWIPALLVLSGRMYIRPETISLLYLAIVLSILFRWERSPWLAFGLPVVQVCWVNTQGLFLLEPILIVFAMASALFQPDAFSVERRAWWRKIGLASFLTGLACLLNPYGLAGAFYPIELAGTMSNPIFKNTIGELKPLLKFIEEVGFDSLPLQLHVLTFVLGGLSFLIPTCWTAWARLVDRRDSPQPKTTVESSKGRKKRETARTRKKTAQDRDNSTHSWSPYLFRGLLFTSFSVLSLAATRNSHQFAAVVGTVTAWNFGEWAAAVQARQLRLYPTRQPLRVLPRLVTFLAIGLTFAAVVSGKYYHWAGEGRTVGIGEEPLWFPREAVKFAGASGMPDRLVGFHNGHPSLFEYYFAPQKKTYTDARLEVMGADLYQQYTDLSFQIGENQGDWADQLDKMGRPSILVDNLDVGNAKLSATLLNSDHWRLVWFDPIACVFVHDSLTKVVQEHAVDFASMHFRREADATTADPATIAAMSKALRHVGTQCRFRLTGEAQARSMFLLGLDYARKQRAIDPGGVDGWKQAGLIEYIRDIVTEETIPRFRLPFDPVFDFSPSRATYDLVRTLELAPDDGYVQYFLAKLYQTRGMDEPAVPLLEKFVEQPNKNLSQQREKARAANQIEVLRSRLGPNPPLKWANLSDLDRVIAGLLASGRVVSAADVMESSYRAEVRPWEWADRLAVLRLHLGQPSKARAIWLAATKDVPTSIRAARVATTYLVEGDFESARSSYRESLREAPDSFEAHYGLAILEQDAGDAGTALSEARLAEKSASNAHSRAASRQIIATVSPFANKAVNRP